MKYNLNLESNIIKIISMTSFFGNDLNISNFREILSRHPEVLSRLKTILPNFLHKKPSNCITIRLSKIDLLARKCLEEQRPEFQTLSL